MRATFFASLVVCGAVGCGTPTATEVFVNSLDRVTALTVSTEALGVALPNCARGSRHYDFAQNTLTITECAASRTVTARPADSVALRVALRAVEIQSVPCNGYDGVNTSVSVAFEAGVDPAGFALGPVSCPGGGVGTQGIATIDASSWSAAKAVLDRLSGGG
jgi:hypothetical protein